MFKQELESSSAFSTGKKDLLRLCTFLPQIWRTFLSYTPVILGSLQSELRLAACAMRKWLQLFSLYMSLEGSGFFLLNIAGMYMKQCLAAEQWLRSTTQRASVFPFLFHASFSAWCSDFAYPLSDQGVQKERKKEKIKGDKERRESKQASKQEKEASASQGTVGTLSSSDIVTLLPSYHVSSSFRHNLCVLEGKGGGKQQHTITLNLW